MNSSQGAPAEWDWMAKAKNLDEAGERFILVTVIQVSGSTPRNPGAKMIVRARGEFHGTIGGGHLEEQVLQEARSLLEDSQALALKISKFPLGAKLGQCCGGSVEVLYERLGDAPQVVLFGGGHVGQALCQVLDHTPFRVTLVEDRPEWRNHENLPESIRRFDGDFEDWIASSKLNPEKTFAIVMTHRHDLDEKIVEALSTMKLKYLGLIGSDAKWKRFLQRYEHRGLPQSQFAGVTCPMGLLVKKGISGKAPKEIAIDIASELLSLVRSTP